MKKLISFSASIIILTLLLSISDGNAQTANNWTSYTVSNGLADNYVGAMAIDAQGVKWFGTDGGVSKFDGTTWTNYTTANGSALQYVRTIAIDANGVKWFGTTGGVRKFDGTSWTTYTTSNGLAHNTVTSAAIDRAGIKWFGTESGGVSKFDGNSWTTYNTSNGLPAIRVLSIGIDSSGNKWFGTYGGGVSKFDGTTWTTYTTSNGLAENIVWSIRVDPQGNIWFGTNGGGVSKFDGTNWTTYTTSNGLGSGRIYAIAFDSEGNKWFGTTAGGVSKFDGTNWTTYTTSNGLVHNSVVSMAIDSYGTKWFGTGGGVSKFSTTSTSVIAYWKFDEGSGTTITDASGNGHNGTLINGATWVAGKSNYAISVNPTSQSYGSVPQSSDFSLSRTGSFTIEAWVNAATSYTGDIYGLIVGHELSSTTTWSLVSKGWGFSLRIGGMSSIDVSADHHNIWTHIAIVYDASTTLLRMYVNGVAKELSTGGTTLAMPSGAILNAVGNLQFGKAQSLSNHYFNGSIDEVRISRVALSPSQFIGYPFTATLTAPVLTSPANGAQLTTYEVTPTWNAVTGATSYQFQMSLSSDFSTLLSDESVTTTSRYTQVEANRTQYWRVRAKTTTATGDWSETRTFLSPVSLTAPTLTSPSNGAQLTAYEVTPTWNAVTGATSYQFQMSLSSDFSTLLSDETVTTTSRYTQVEANRTQYWRVRAKNSTTTGPWSEIRAFLSPAQLVAPTLTSPANGAQLTSLEVTPTWNAVTGATSYQFQMSESSTFSTLLSDETVTTTSRYTQLNYNKTYYWRVRAKNSTSTGSWSETRSFLSPRSGVSGTHFRTTYSTTGSNATVLIQTSTTITVNSNPFTLSTGDEIAIYTPLPDTLCCGLGIWNRSNMAITVWGDNDQTATIKEGFTSGQNYTFRLWDASESREYSNVEATFSSGSSTYSANGMSIVSTLRSITGRYRTAYNTTGSNSTVLIQTSTTITVNSNPFTLSTGDEIAIYTPLPDTLCCGVGIWNGSNLAITVWGDNDQTTTIKEGFASDQDYTFRLWDASESKEYSNAEATFSSGSSTYSANGMSIVNTLNVSDKIQLPISLASGWNIISSNVTPSNLLMTEIFKNIVSNVVIVKNISGKVYWPRYSINQIGNWNVVDGYQIYMSNAATLTIEGLRVNPLTPISLPAGWSMIAYLPTTAMSPVRACSTISDKVVIMKEVSGKVYWPRYGINQIGTMQVGKGYQIYLSSTGTLIYPAASTSKEGLNLAEGMNRGQMSPQHFAYIRGTGANATILVKMEMKPTINETVLEVGDEIGVFTPEGICAGAGVWNGDDIVITVWGDNSETMNIDGFTEGQSYNFKLWDKSATIEKDISVIAESGNLNYSENGITIISYEKSSAVPDNFILRQNYPNPFNPTTRIEYQIKTQSEVTLAIYNTAGQLIRILVQSAQPAGVHSVEWDGRNSSGIQVPSGIYLYRLQAGNVVATQKMVLMK